MGRYAFSRQIASFQAIKHKLADMYVAHRAGALQRVLRRVGALDGRRRAAGRRRRGARRRERRLLARRQGEHPDARRHGLHLGVRLPPLLSPRQVAAGSCKRLARAPVSCWKEKLVARRLERTNAALRRTRWISTTPRRSRLSAPGARVARSNAERQARRARRWRTGIEARAPRRARARQGLSGEEGRSRLRRLTWPKEYGGRGLPPIFR